MRETVADAETVADEGDGGGRGGGGEGEGGEDRAGLGVGEEEREWGEVGGGRRTGEMVLLMMAA